MPASPRPERRTGVLMPPRVTHEPARRVNVRWRAQPAPRSLRGRSRSAELLLRLAGVGDGRTHEGEAIAVAVLLVLRLGGRVDGPERDQRGRLVCRRALIAIHHDYLPLLRLITSNVRASGAGAY